MTILVSNNLIESALLSPQKVKIIIVLIIIGNHGVYLEGNNTPAQ